jgi:hypothetical protein
MNAISPAHVTARDIAMLQRLAELGMQLAERTAMEALYAPHAAEGRSDPSLLFIRLSNMVQGCITDRVRLAAARERNTVNEIREIFGISYETPNLPMQ